MTLLKMKRFLYFLIPPENWRTLVAILTGGLTGLIVLLLYISNSGSYLSDNPRTCVNCHVMSPQFATWSHSAHSRNTNCNDCHVPQNNVFSHYYFKAKDGLRHSKVFTLRQEPQVIIIKEAGLNVVQENCKRCHQKLNENVSTIKVTGKNYLHGQGRLCWSCHRETPHGRVNSLSSVPYSRVPLLESPVPVWLKNILIKK
jgi:cytochrome c nitrite reductase small subunit